MTDIFQRLATKYPGWRDKVNWRCENQFERRLFWSAVLGCTALVLFAGTAAQIDMVFPLGMFVAGTALLTLFPAACHVINRVWRGDQDEDHRLVWNLGQGVAWSALTLATLPHVLRVADALIA